MCLEIRIIGLPEEVAEAEAALRDRFVIHSMRHYSSKYSETDRRSYIRASLKAESGVTFPLEIPEDIANLRIKLKDLGDVNNVFLCYHFLTDCYVKFSVASELNRRIQNDIRDVIAGDTDGVDGRLDQTFKSTEGSAIAVYHSGDRWMTIPCKEDLA